MGNDHSLSRAIRPWVFAIIGFSIGLVYNICKINYSHFKGLEFLDDIILFVLMTFIIPILMTLILPILMLIHNKIPKLEEIEGLLQKPSVEKLPGDQYLLAVHKLLSRSGETKPTPKAWSIFSLNIPLSIKENEDTRKIDEKIQKDFLDYTFYVTLFKNNETELKRKIGLAFLYKVVDDLVKNVHGHNNYCFDRSMNLHVQMLKEYVALPDYAVMDNGKEVVLGFPAEKGKGYSACLRFKQPGFNDIKPGVTKYDSFKPLYDGNGFNEDLLEDIVDEFKIKDIEKEQAIEIIKELEAPEEKVSEMVDNIFDLINDTAKFVRQQKGTLYKSRNRRA